MKKINELNNLNNKYEEEKKIIKQKIIKKEKELNEKEKELTNNEIELNNLKNQKKY